jgi:excisionase family DNA binding protein
MRHEMSTVPPRIGMTSDVMTTKQAAKRLRISLRHLMFLIAEGKLPGSYKLGMQRFIPRKAVESRIREVAKWKASHARR